MKRRNLLAAGIAGAPLALAASLGLPGVAVAQDGSRRLIVGFPPGTAPDLVARALAQAMGGNVIVDNRTGAGGQIATNTVAKSTEPGMLLLGELGSIAIAPAAFSRLPYDPVRELAIVSEVVRSNFLLVVPATSPAQDLAGFIAAARASREPVLFGTFGAGTPGHFGGEMLAEQAGFKIEPVHYRSTGDAVAALVAGDVRAAMVSTALGVAQVRGGRMRALATSASQRPAQLPDVPTFAEGGLPNLAVSSWFAIFAPANTPEATLEALSREVITAVQTPALRQTLGDAGFTVTGTSRAESQRMWQSEAERWAAVVKATGFRGD
jgi:tripartite-type tricarboxylate transporter receptor subunit TctC